MPSAAPGRRKPYPPPPRSRAPGASSHAPRRSRWRYAVSVVDEYPRTGACCAQHATCTLRLGCREPDGVCACSCVHALRARVRACVPSTPPRRSSQKRFCERALAPTPRPCAHIAAPAHRRVRVRAHTIRQVHLARDLHEQYCVQCVRASARVCARARACGRPTVAQRCGAAGLVGAAACR
jgi:hypothetical protein